MVDKKFEIPQAPVAPVSTEPKSMIIYAAPKVGKTSIVAQLPDSLIVELEKGGADALNARYININNPTDVIPLLQQVATDPSIRFLILDTITKLDEWSELTGTYAFMQKPQGKKFNVVDGKRVNHKDAAWDTVHSIGEGYGYRYSREEMITWYNAAINTGKTVILLAHIRDKFIESKSGDVVEAIDLNLTGKVKSIYASRVDVIAHLKRKGNQASLEFESMGSVTAGSRYSYLKGSIVISESKEDGTLITYWDRIFPSLKNK